MIVINTLWTIVIINQYSEGVYWAMPISDQVITRIYLLPCILIIIAIVTILAASLETMD